MRTTRLTEADSCPYCLYKLDAVTASPDNPKATPEPGDFNVCIKCASLLVFDEGLRVRRPTVAELAEAAATPTVSRMIAVVSKLRRDTHGHDA